MLAAIDGQFRAHGGVIDAVVDVEIDHPRIAHPGAGHVAFVGDDQGGAGIADRFADPLIVVGDGAEDHPQFLDRQPALAQQVKGHEGRMLGVVLAMDHVADIVQQAGDGGQFGLARGQAELGQNTRGVLTDAADVRHAVIGVADGFEVFVGHRDQPHDLGIGAQGQVGDAGGIESVAAGGRLRRLVFLGCG